MNESSSTHLVLIPSFNPGPKGLETVRQARTFWSPVWVVVDGSDDGTSEALRRLAATDSGLRVIALATNRGKGAAVLHGLLAAQEQGFTHALVMDADGQHPAEHIPDFMARSLASPEAGRKLTPRTLADRLARFGVHPRTLRLGDGVVQRGYRGGDLIDAFARYL